jgi:predicted enzyme related to lactoylglutathione lyase
MRSYPPTDLSGAGVGAGPRPVVHLELHTRRLSEAHCLYSSLFGWRGERITTGRGNYLALDLGGIAGGMVECGTDRPLWIPYVEVERVDLAADRARALGARVLLEPREGPAGWRSVIATDDGGEVALWQRKETR